MQGIKNASVWLLVFIGVCFIFYPPMRAPGLTQMQLLFQFWPVYLVGLGCEAIAVLLTRTTRPANPKGARL